jgi:type VII secretion-associated serine protease mycosin
MTPKNRRPLAAIAKAAAAIVAATVVALAGATSARADIVRDYEYWLGDYGFTTAWNTSRGEGVTVAIIDTGVNGNVAELQGVVKGGTDVSGLGTPDGQTPVGEESSHGTMVASLLAGRGAGEGAGVIGVAPAADLLTVSVAFGQDTGATKSNDDQIAEAVVWAVDNGADVINMSLTRNTRDWPESWDDAFMYAFEHDVVVVAAAGNRGAGTSEVGAPATIPGVLTVAGVDKAKNASFDASSQGITIGVAAPSEDLVGVQPDGKYVVWDGTSGAAPLVSGLVALVRSEYPDLDAANVIERVIATADPNGQEVPSSLYGNGLIDPVAALTADVPEIDPDTLVDGLAEWITLHRRADVDAPDQAAETETPMVVPIADPPLPRSDGAQTLLPTPWTLAYITVPLSLVAGFGTLAALLGIGATRHTRRTVRTREQ